MNARKDGRSYMLESGGNRRISVSDRKNGLCIGPLHIHYGVIVAVQSPDRSLDLLTDLVIRQTEVEGDHRVENQVRVGGSGHHAEVVDVDGVIDAVDQGLDPLPGLFCDAVIRHHRVHVDDCLAAQTLLELFFHIVDLIVEIQHVFGRRHLRMEGDHHPAGTVVVDDQIMDADDTGVGHHQPADAGDEFRRRRRAQQRVQGIPGGADTGPEDERSHQNTAPAVDLQTGELADQRGGQYGGGGDAVAEAVSGGGLHGGRVQLLADPAVIEPHIALYGNGGTENDDDQGAGIHRHGVEDLLNGRLGQLQAHQQNQQCHRKPGEILDTAVAEGVLGVGLLPGQLETQQRHKRAAGVGEVVECVGSDGDGTGNQSGKEFTCKEQQVQTNAHRSAENAVGLPGGGLVQVWFDEQPGQQ